MKPGQIAQLQELRKCYMMPYSFEWTWVRACLDNGINDRLNKIEKGFLRKFYHGYRHQIKAMKRNQL